jgi:hypothetical protein
MTQPPHHENPDNHETDGHLEPNAYTELEPSPATASPEAPAPPAPLEPGDQVEAARTAVDSAIKPEIQLDQEDVSELPFPEDFFRYDKQRRKEVKALRQQSLGQRLKLKAANVVADWREPEDSYDRSFFKRPERPSKDIDRDTLQDELIEQIGPLDPKYIGKLPPETFERATQLAQDYAEMKPAKDIWADPDQVFKYEQLSALLSHPAFICDERSAEFVQTVVDSSSQPGKAIPAAHYVDRGSIFTEQRFAPTAEVVAGFRRLVDSPVISQRVENAGDGANSRVEVERFLKPITKYLVARPAKGDTYDPWSDDGTWELLGELTQKVTAARATDAIIPIDDAQTDGKLTAHLNDHYTDRREAILTKVEEALEILDR